ncbi:hypothetical protein L210DRAFT_988120 [Boletus edulis BED1]|uniref:Uncharacterized protein n=1 Tax=Boletus edulis BED1 TaxID=1328754 RepID=A0AAD4G5X8_BOLED|nr:hypothetical protein L210DRAFT_988120 [Boletus edulis BED1]
MYAVSQGTRQDVKIFPVVDLTCVMQVILICGGRVTPDTVALTLRAHEKPRRRSAWRVLDNIEEPIPRYSVADNEEVEDWAGTASEFFLTDILICMEQLGQI